jgi:hypothetical protein
MTNSEDRLQSEIFFWFWNTYPTYRRCLFHVPNGGFRNLKEAAKLKAMGVVAGVPDLLLVNNGALVAFELKTPTGRLSDKQKLVHSAWIAQGIPVHVVRSLEQFQQLIESYL